MNEASIQTDPMNSIPWRTLLLVLCLFTLIAGLLHHRGLSAPMFYDSAELIGQKRSLYAKKGFSGMLSTGMQRPVSMGSFYLNYLIWGMNPVAFRIVNLVLLAGTAVAVVLIIHLLLGVSTTPPSASPENRFVIALCLGVLFLAHPLNTYLTLFIWQRTALLACFFGYWSLAAYLAVRSGVWKNTFMGYGLCLMLLTLAVLSKQNAVVVPAAFILAEAAFFQRDPKKVILQAGAYVLVLVCLLGIAALAIYLYKNSNVLAAVPKELAKQYGHTGMSLADVALTQCRVAFTYLSTILLPLPSKVQLFGPQVISTSLYSPPSTLAAVLGVVALVGGGLYSLKKIPLLGFGILFFFVGLIPEAVLVPQYSFFGYRAILPMLGVLIVVAHFAVEALHRSKATAVATTVRRAVVAIFLVVFAFLAIVSVYRVEIWRDPIRLWQTTVSEFRPSPYRYERIVAAQALNNLGQLLMDRGRTGEAVDYLRKAASIAPVYAEIYNNLGVAHARAGHTEVAIHYFRKAVRLAPRHGPSKRNLKFALNEVLSRSEP